MTRRLTSAFLALALIPGAMGIAQAGETNCWPFWVGQKGPDGQWREWQAVGPLFFRQNDPSGTVSRGFRPFYLGLNDRAEGLRESTLLYPIYVQRASEGHTSWTVFNLINQSGTVETDGSGRTTGSFDVWPFYFSRDTGFADSSYRALFPIHGSIKRRFAYDRVDWTLFPLYLRSEKGGVTTTSTPWPILRRSEGAGYRGLAVWPLFGTEEKTGVARKRFLLWPLLYRQETRLDEPVPTVREGFLPFYARERSAEVDSASYLWPFFGYTDRQAPQKYHEVRYLWPFLVQGRGEGRYVNRWGPFYTHSVIKGVDKTWLGWPLIRHQSWADGDVQRSRAQFLYFIFWTEQQTSLARPGLAPASRTHFWPLFTTWNNGAGRVQAQFPSPLDVFFPGNERIRRLYAPLFALYRLDQKSPVEVRTSLLWNAVTWSRSPQRREFHLGPLFSTEAGAAGRRIAVGNGLVGLRRAAGGGWRLFLFDFSPLADQSAASTPP